MFAHWLIISGSSATCRGQIGPICTRGSNDEGKNPQSASRSQERLPLTYVTAVAKIALVVIFWTEKEVKFPLLFKLLLYLQHEDRIK